MAKYKDENKEKLTRARDILISIANNPRNSKFEKLSTSDVFRSKQLRNDNNNKNNKKRFRRYKKGSIIFVDFGIGIGNEFSHPHFCVVMDNKDNPLKGTLTVIPLTSKEKDFFIKLEKNMIYKFFEKTINDVRERKKLISAIYDLENDPLTQTPGIYYPRDENMQNILDEFAKRHNIKGSLTLNQARRFLEVEDKYSEEIANFYLKYNKNTYANVQALTTISKFKIFKPINPLDPIRDIILPDTQIKKLENEIIKNLTSIKIDKP